MDFRGHLRALLRFSGRERRAPFWLWVALTFGSSMVIAAIGMVLVIGNVMTRMQHFAADHPDQTTVTQGSGDYSIAIRGEHPELSPPFLSMLEGWAVVTILIVLLLAAAVSRRLHDSGRAGWWGLMPLPFLFGGYAMMGRLFSSFGAAQALETGTFFLLLTNNLVYLGVLLILIVLCCLPTQEHANRYGPPPGARVG